MTQNEIHLQIPTPNYTLLKFERAGLPALLVVNEALNRFRHHDIFPWYLSILIEFQAPDDKGMPGTEEWETIDALGDRLERKTLDTRTDRGAENALFIARLTWNGRRQQIYYAHNPKSIDRSLRETIAADTSEREWEYHMEEDPAWQLAQPFFTLFETAQADN